MSSVQTELWEFRESTITEWQQWLGESSWASITKFTIHDCFLNPSLQHFPKRDQNCPNEATQHSQCSRALWVLRRGPGWRWRCHLALLWTRTCRHDPFFCVHCKQASSTIISSPGTPLSAQRMSFKRSRRNGGLPGRSEFPKFSLNQGHEPLVSFCLLCQLVIFVFAREVLFNLKSRVCLLRRIWQALISLLLVLWWTLILMTPSWTVFYIMSVVRHRSFFN